MEINDELMMPCAQCCRKHLSAALACCVDAAGREETPPQYWHILLARAVINLTEADQGYESHRPYAVGLLVTAEIECPTREERIRLREARLETESGGNVIPFASVVSDCEWRLAHIAEAEREYPDVVGAVRLTLPAPNASPAEIRQLNADHILAQLKWLDENVFGHEPKEKGEEQMACAKKPAKAPKAAAKKAACKGGKCKSGCKK